jgi:hypothetical protein
MIFRLSQTNGDFGDLEEKRDSSMKLLAIVTQKGSFLSKTASFELLRVKIGRPVRPVPDMKKLKAATSPYQAIAINYVTP